MTFSYAGVMFFEMACELSRFLFLNCMFIDSYVTLVVPSTARDRIEAGEQEVQLRLCQRGG